MLPPIEMGYALPVMRLKEAMEQQGISFEKNVDEIKRAYRVFGDIGKQIKAILVIDNED